MKQQVLVERVIDAPPLQVALAITATCRHQFGRTRAKQLSHGGWEIVHKTAGSTHTYRLFMAPSYTATRTTVQMLAKGRYAISEANLRATMKVQLARIAMAATPQRALA